MPEFRVSRGFCDGTKKASGIPDACRGGGCFCILEPVQIRQDLYRLLVEVAVNGSIVPCVFMMMGIMQIREKCIWRLPEELAYRFLSVL